MRYAAMAECALVDMWMLVDLLAGHNGDAAFPMPPCHARL